MEPTITIAGQKLIFRRNGDVAVSENGTTTVRGAWRGRATTGEAPQNGFHYTIDGADRPALAAEYRFTDTNQLQVVLNGANGKSDPALLVGGIEIDDQHDIVYRLVDDGGTATGAVVVLYSDLSIERNTNALIVGLQGGGQATVTGSKGIASLEAAQNRIDAFAADDLLRFRATTLNDLDDGGSLEVPAKLEFAGSWDIQKGQLVFLSKVTGNLARPDVSIGFSGTLGAVTAGFVYFADAEGTRSAFTIRGQHVWQGGDSKTDLNWQSSLGFSDKKFSASANFDLNRVQQNGQRLSLKGGLTLQQADGAALAMALSLEAEYAWQDNALVFKALVNTGAGGFNYDLMLEGRLRADNGNLTFAIRFTNAPGAEGLTVDLAASGDHNSAVQAIAFHLRISPQQVDATIEAHLVVRQRFVAGVGRVLEPVTEPAGAGA